MQIKFIVPLDFLYSSIFRYICLAKPILQNQIFSVTVFAFQFQVNKFCLDYRFLNGRKSRLHAAWTKGRCGTFCLSDMNFLSSWDIHETVPAAEVQCFKPMMLVPHGRSFHRTAEMFVAFYGKEQLLLLVLPWWCWQQGTCSVPRPPLCWGPVCWSPNIHLKC